MNYSPECSESLDRYMYEISSIPFLSEEEEKDLFAKMQKGSIEARNDLVRAHLKLVTAKAAKLSGRGVPIADLICEGNIGLLFAAEEFDPDKGRFSTIAEYWIKRAMTDAVNSRSGLTHTEGSPDRFEVYKEKLKSRLSNRYRKKEATIDPFAWINEVLSLDEPLGEDESAKMSDFLADTSQNPEDILIAESLEKGMRSDIYEILSTLPELSKVYLTLYFGLDGNKAMTIDEIADAYKQPVRKVDRVIKTTLRTLRTNEKVRALKSYLSE